MEASVGDDYTFSAANPRARIDYVLYSDDVLARTAAVLSTGASDHLPVVADLELPGERVGLRAGQRASR